MKQLHKILGAELMLAISEAGESDLYPAGFFNWLQYNEHIWAQFELHALTMSAKRKRYSARTIIEVMRWNSDLREQQKKPLFKMSNNMIPGMARLWMKKHGTSHPKFFDLR